MKKLLFLFAMCLTLTLCACSTDTNSKSLDDENTTNATEKLTTSEPITEEPAIPIEESKKLEHPTVQTPGDNTFEVSADDIELQIVTGPNPTDPRFVEVTDADTKVKVYNMLKNALECEPIDYNKYVQYFGGTRLGAIIQVAGGGECRLFLGSPKSDCVNFGVLGTLDGETVSGDYLLDEEFASEFFALLGKEY